MFSHADNFPYDRERLRQEVDGALSEFDDDPSFVFHVDVEDARLQGQDWEPICMDVTNFASEEATRLRGLLVCFLAQCLFGPKKKATVTFVRVACIWFRCECLGRLKPAPGEYLLC